MKAYLGPSLGLSWALLGLFDVCWAVMGMSWAVLGLPWAVLRPVLSHLVAILGHLLAMVGHLEPSWGYLRPQPMSTRILEPILPPFWGPNIDSTIMYFRFHFRFIYAFGLCFFTQKWSSKALTNNPETGNTSAPHSEPTWKGVGPPYIAKTNTKSTFTGRSLDEKSRPGALKRDPKTNPKIN